MYHTVFLVESAYRNRWDVIHGSDDGRFLLPWEPGPNITRHELRSSVFRYVPSGVAFVLFYITFNRECINPVDDILLLSKVWRKILVQGTY